MPFFASVLLAAGMKLAAERSVVQSEPLSVTVRLPEEWSVADGQVVPAAPLRSACQIHTYVVTGSDWNGALAPFVRDAAASRVLFKHHGHVAVEVRKHSGAASQKTVFINLDDVQAGTFELWNIENDNTAQGHQCSMAFDAMLGTVEFQ